MKYEIYNIQEGTSSIILTARVGNSFRKSILKIGTSHTIQHEYDVLNMLKRSWTCILPHFQLEYKLSLVYVDTMINQSTDKGSITSYPTQTNTPHLTLISPKLTGIPLTECTPPQIASIILQLVLVSSLLNISYGYTHYDMHLNNIIIQPTTPDLMLVVFDDDNQFIVPTMGVHPVLIDHEHAYINECESEGSSGLSTYGITPWKQNPYFDFARIMSDAHKHMDDIMKRDIKTILMNIFGSQINEDGLMDTGDSINSMCVDKIVEILEFEEDNAFTEDPELFVDCLLSLQNEPTECIDEVSVIELGIESLLNVIEQLFGSVQPEHPSRVVVNSVYHHLMNERSNKDLVNIDNLSALLKHWNISMRESMKQLNAYHCTNPIQLFGALHYKWSEYMSMDDSTHITIYYLPRRSVSKVAITSEMREVIQNTTPLSLATRLYDIIHDTV
jgi:hypothetical protein